MGKFPFLGSVLNPMTELLHLLCGKIDVMMNTMCIIDELKQMIHRLEVKNQTLLDEILKTRNEMSKLIEENRKVVRLSGLCEVDYLTIKEAAAYCHYKETTLRKYVEEGRIEQGPKGRGRRIMVSKASLDEFIGKKKKSNPDDLCTTKETSSIE